MTPPQGATAERSRWQTSTAAPASARPGARRGGAPQSPAPRRPPLRVVPTRRARPPGRRTAGRARLLTLTGICCLVLSLLVVVVGQALLANGQVRLSTLEHQLTFERTAHRQHELAVAELETPARIVAVASGTLRLVRPATVTELPYVSLTTPLPAPKLLPASPASASATPTAP